MIKKNINSLFLISFICFVYTPIKSQNIDYAKKVIDTLCSPSMHGRGYVNSGDKIAANYIISELSKLNLNKVGDSYSQGFNVSVNTFPTKVKVTVDNTDLKPGKDFYVYPTSLGLKGKYKAVMFNKSIIENTDSLNLFNQKNYKNSVIIVDDKDITDEDQKKIIEAMYSNPLKAKAIVMIEDDSIKFGVSQELWDYTLIQAKRNQIFNKAKTIKFDIENLYYKNYPTQNIVAYYKGAMNPDTFIVFTAHYDHLGRMGSEIYIPGANDNASGVATCLDLAKYYAEEGNESFYSIAFIFTSSEELGLLGAKYFVENPLIPLNKIKFLVNLDIIGTGEDGLKVVNGSVFNEEFKRLVSINNEFEYVKDIKRRGEAAISDHHPFYKKGVKSFFIYTIGGSPSYHTMYDKPELLPLFVYEDLFNLLVDFVESFEL